MFGGIFLSALYRLRRFGNGVFSMKSTNTERSLFLLLLVFAGLCLTLVVFYLPESHPPERRGASLGQVFRAYGHMLRAPLALGFILCMGLSFAGMFTFITASPFVYIQYFGVSPHHYGGLFALNIAGVIVATLLNARLVPRFGTSQMLKAGVAVAALSGITLALVGASSLAVSIVLSVRKYPNRIKPTLSLHDRLGYVVEHNEVLVAVLDPGALMLATKVRRYEKYAGVEFRNRYLPIPAKLHDFLLA